MKKMKEIICSYGHFRVKRTQCEGVKLLQQRIEIVIQYGVLRADNKGSYCDTRR